MYMPKMIRNEGAQTLIHYWMGHAHDVGFFAFGIVLCLILLVRQSVVSIGSLTYVLNSYTVKVEKPNN